MGTNQYPDLFVNYCAGFNMHTGNKNPIVLDKSSSFSPQPMSSPIVFNSVKIKFYFTPLNDSNSFGIVNYDAHFNTKIVYSINHSLKPMSIQQLITLHHISELERTLF